MKKFLISMFSSNKTGNVSSKRVVAFLFSIVVAFIYIRCNICGCEIDNHITDIIVAILILLGCDSIVNVFNGFKKGGND